MLCGDEVRACVVDYGSSFARFGTAGQDLPRHIFKADVGLRNSETLVGDTKLRFVNTETEIVNPFANNDINWDIIEATLAHGISESMRENPSECPIFISESKFRTLKQKINLAEVAFEKLSSPALYMASNAMLSSFSVGRPTSIVIDISGSELNISPVIDGFVLKKSSVSCNRGGNYIDQFIYEEMKSRNISITPWFERGQEPVLNTRPSFRDYHVRDVIRDIKQWMCFVPYNPIPDESRVEFFTQKISIPPYVLPDGTPITASDSLCTIHERVYFPVPNTATSPANASGTAGVSTPNLPTNASGNILPLKRQQPQPVVGLPAHAQPIDIDLSSPNSSLTQLVTALVNKCDVDVRRDLLQHIVVVGGGSMNDGIIQRLVYELSELLPTSIKVKNVSQLPIERVNATWIGGSILSICGSFQQMWLSKQEYQEYGDNIIPQKFNHCYHL